MDQFDDPKDRKNPTEDELPTRRKGCFRPCYLKAAITIQQIPNDCAPKQEDDCHSQKDHRPMENARAPRAFDHQFIIDYDPSPFIGYFGALALSFVHLVGGKRKLWDFQVRSSIIEFPWDLPIN
ncbi:MAG: hypothetical protein ACPGAP_05890 [Akkermansiaceae bacterium]